jgi:hypothetical protein
MSAMVGEISRHPAAAERRALGRYRGVGAGRVPGWPRALGDCEGLSEGAPVVSPTGPDPVRALRAPLKKSPILSGFWALRGSKPALRASSMTV